MVELGPWGPLVLAAVGGVLAALAIGAWWRGRRASRRARAGIAAEDVAERLLRAAGYRVLRRPYSATAHVIVDGERQEVAVRADMLVERGGRRFVTEVKSTGRVADPTLPETRRQLLEYAVALGGGEVLLVDTVEQRIVHVAFRYGRRARTPRAAAVGLAVGLALGFAAARLLL